MEDGGFDATLDAVQSTPLSQIRAEVAAMHPIPARAGWVRELAVGRRDSLDELGQAIRSYHHHVLAPLVPTLHSAAAAELRRRAWQVANRGIEDVLTTLHPFIRWRDGVLEVDFPADADVDLGGRGLSLCPSAAWTRPGFGFHWEQQPGLVYPVPPPDWSLHGDHGDREARLAVLLGATRARVLCALASEHNTTSLATSLGLSTSSASITRPPCVVRVSWRLARTAGPYATLSPTWASDWCPRRRRPNARPAPHGPGTTAGAAWSAVPAPCTSGQQG